MIHKQHQLLFDEIAIAASTKESLHKAQSILTRWWSDLLVKNLEKRGVKKDLINSLMYYTNQK